MRILSKRRAMSVVAFSTQSLRRSVSRALNFAIASFARARRWEPRAARARRCCSTFNRLASPPEAEKLRRVEVHPQANALLVYAKVEPTTVELVDGFTRDVSNIGHYGTGDLEIRITDNSLLSQAEPLLAMSYANS